MVNDRLGNKDGGSGLLERIKVRVLERRKMAEGGQEKMGEVEADDAWRTKTG